MHLTLLISLILYLIVIIFVAIYFSNKMENEDDFLVAGRSFNLWITTFSLFATWFGAGTLIAATDEVASAGLRATALEPYGAGFCLILAGLFFAKPLWEMKLLTYGDFFRDRFGSKVEFLSVFINIPVFVGWIAVQFISMAHILEIFFDIPFWILVMIISLVAMILTMLGGMWSVSLTDSLQLVVIISGLFYLVYKVVLLTDGGWQSLINSVPQENLIIIPRESVGEFFNWFGIFSISAFGNLTGQDLGQRIFSAKSANVAQNGCLIAGVMYFFIGSIPVFLGLTAMNSLGVQAIEGGAILTKLMNHFLDPITVVILVLTIISAVMSTITSALLAPASLLSHNLLKKYFQGFSSLYLCRIGVVIITILSVLTVFSGKGVYELLEHSYAIGFVGFFTPLVMGLFTKWWNQKACLISMFCGLFVWMGQVVFSIDIPWAMIAVVVSLLFYLLSYFLLKFLKFD